MSHSKTALALSTFLWYSGPVRPSPIVMNLSITDPLQTTEPGSVIKFDFELVNTIGVDLPIFGFVNLDAPADLSEIVVPFTVPANETVTGTLSFSSGEHRYFRAANICQLPTMPLLTLGLGVLLTTYARRARQPRQPSAERENPASRH
jgi:hypothetical protein